MSRIATHALGITLALAAPRVVVAGDAGGSAGLGAAQNGTKGAPFWRAPLRPKNVLKEGLWVAAGYVGWQVGKWGYDYARGKRPVFGTKSRFQLGATVAAMALGAGALGYMPEPGLWRTAVLGAAAATFGAELVNQGKWYLTWRGHKLGRKFGIAAAVGLPMMLWSVHANVPDALLPALGLGTALGAMLVLNPAKRVVVGTASAIARTVRGGDAKPRSTPRNPKAEIASDTKASRDKARTCRTAARGGRWKYPVGIVLAFSGLPVMFTMLAVSQALLPTTGLWANATGLGTAATILGLFAGGVKLAMSQPPLEPCRGMDCVVCGVPSGHVQLEAEAAGAR